MDCTHTHTFTYNLEVVSGEKGGKPDLQHIQGRGGGQPLSNASEKSRQIRIEEEERGVEWEVMRRKRREGGNDASGWDLNVRLGAEQFLMMTRPQLVSFSVDRD